MASHEFLLPDTSDPASSGFWEAVERGELRVQSCGACGRRRMPPRPMCPHCQSQKVEWEKLSGRGAIWSFVVAHPPLLPAYAAFAPYPVVVVALDEDPNLRLVGNLVASRDGAINEIDPSTIEIGDPVRVVFSPVGDGVLPRWQRI